MRVSVAGRSGHSAYPAEAVSAIEYVAELVAQIHRMHAEFQLNGPFDRDYRVPHSTLHVGVFHGGTALNIVPDQCRFEFELRHLPEDDPDEIL